MNIPQLPSRSVTDVGLLIQAKLLEDFKTIEQELQNEEERKDSFFKAVCYIIIVLK